MAMAAGTIPAIEAVRRQGQRLDQLVRTFTPADFERPTPCRGWLVRDLLAHNASGAERVSEYLRAFLAGQPTERWQLKDLSKYNQAGVDAYRNRSDLPELLGQALQETLDLLDQTVERGLARSTFTFFDNITPEEMAGILTADVATHQWDYGQAIGRPQPLDPAILSAAIPMLFEGLLPKSFLPEKAGNLVCTFGIKLTDIPNGEWVIDINRGQIAVRRESIAAAKVKTIADVGTFILVTFGRVNPFIQMIRGRVKSSGNPLLGMKFGTLFQKV